MKCFLIEWSLAVLPFALLVFAAQSTHGWAGDVRALAGTIAALNVAYNLRVIWHIWREVRP